jgi:threonyl-tRNA synthetase
MTAPTTPAPTRTGTWPSADSRARSGRKGIAYKTIPGEAAFYGPKIDVKLVDVLGRLWQLSTVQFDFNLPARFELEYVGEDGERHQPVMVHRALFGSVERFFGVLIEHYAGAFPLWLAPVQVGLVPISERHHAYAKKVEAELKAAGLRVEVDDRNEKMNGKIRDFANQKTPYILVFGDKEEAAGRSASAPAPKATRAPCRWPSSSPRQGAGRQPIDGGREFCSCLLA